MLRADGTVLTFGTNGAGQLGFANNVMPNPVPAPVMSGAVSVAAGDAHTVVLKADGTLWTFGANDLGQLGDPTTCCNFDPHPVPTQVLAGARSVAAGATHTVVVKSDGTVWTWGSGFFGELGRLVPFTPGGPDANPVPTQVMTGAVAAAAGRNFTVVLKADGTVWTFGFNSTGQLGRQTNGVSEQSVPTQVLSGVSAVAAGGSHTLALKVDGTVWTFGNNLDGQLGTAINVGISAPNVPTHVMSGAAAVSAGEYDTVVVKADGTVFTFGRNDFGQLGTPNVGHQPNPVPTQVASGAVAAAAGISHTLVLKADGTVLGFGHAGFGELAGSIDPPFDPAPRLTLAGAMIPGTVCQSKQDDHGGDKHKGRGKNHHERRDKHNRHDDDQCEGSD